MMGLVERIEKHVEKSINLMPCNSNRASMIGSACERQLVYYRVAWDKAIPPDVRLQMVFNEGNLQEKAVLRLLEEIGLEVYGQQADFFDHKAKLSGHLDAVIRDPKEELNDGKPFPTDIKSMSDHIFNTITGPESFQSRPWLKKYPAQIQCYCFFKGVERGALICKNKTTGEIKDVWFTLDIDYMDFLLKRCDRINAVVDKWHDTPEPEREALLPERVKDLDECKMCGFRLMCRPQIDFTAPLKIEDNPEAEALIDRHEALSEAASEYGTLHKRLTDMLKVSAKGSGYDTYNALIGNWLVNGKSDRAGKWSFDYTHADQPVVEPPRRGRPPKQQEPTNDKVATVAATQKATIKPPDLSIPKENYIELLLDAMRFHTEAQLTAARKAMSIQKLSVKDFTQDEAKAVLLWFDANDEGKE
jgi:hypothetical protein